MYFQTLKYRHGWLSLSRLRIDKGKQKLDNVYNQVVWDKILYLKMPWSSCMSNVVSSQLKCMPNKSNARKL